MGISHPFPAQAHPDVFDTFLQLLDDGVLTDGQGQQVNFRDAIVLFTSNVGSQLILDSVADFADADRATTDDDDAAGAAELTTIKKQVLDAMRAKFRPEFLNRLDELVVFNPLRTSVLADIVRLEVASIAKRVNATHAAGLTLSDAAVDMLATTGFDAAYGARPLKRLVTKSLETPLSRAILNGDLDAGDVASFTVQNERLTLDIVKQGELPPEPDAEGEEEPSPAKKSRSLSR